MLKRVIQTSNRGISRPWSSKANFIPSVPPPIQQCCSVPVGLDIDYETPLWGRIPSYTTHMVISTGRSDWASKTETDPHGWFAKDLKKAFTRSRRPDQDSQVFDEANSVLPLISCSSLSPNLPAETTESVDIGLYAFPRSEYIQLNRMNTIGDAYESSLDEVVAYEQRSQGQHPPSSIAPETGLRQTDGSMLTKTSAPGVTILICGHGGRDKRCGVIGPLLQREFITKLKAAGLKIQEGLPQSNDQAGDEEHIVTAQVALISHIGGHKWAGNVIIYVSPRLSHHALAGMGIWYGRIMPQHVEGIVAETVLKGNIIADACRGGMRLDGSTLMRE